MVPASDSVFVTSAGEPGEPKPFDGGVTLLSLTIVEGVSGLPLLMNGMNMCAGLRHCRPLRPIAPNELLWDPAQTRAAFTGVYHCLPHFTRKPYRPATTLARTSLGRMLCHNVALISFLLMLQIVIAFPLMCQILSGLLVMLHIIFSLPQMLRILSWLL